MKAQTLFNLLFLLFLLFLVSKNLLISQTPCYTNDLPLNRMMGMSAKYWELEENYKEQLSQVSGLRGGSLLNIPVVIHVVHRSGQTNLPSIFELEAELERINKGLRGEPLCPGQAAGVDTKIELCLAQRQHNNQPTNGVHYYESELGDLDACSEDEALKRLPQQSGLEFPSSDYLNIFLVNQICAPCHAAGCEIGGYSSYAAAHGTLADGIVLERRILQGGSCDDIKIGLHELGHYLNLLHTFHGGCKNDNCVEDGDRVCDTPPSSVQQISGRHPCLDGGIVNSCTTDVNAQDPNNLMTQDEPDAMDNYMSYAPESCMRTYTSGQRLRIRSVLTGVRRSLIESKGCELPCEDPIIWDIDIKEPIYAGEGFTPENNSSGTDSYKWELGGRTYTGREPVMQLDTSGMYELKIYTDGLGANCADTLKIIIFAGCQISDALIRVSADRVSPGETVIFEQLSGTEDGVIYTWYVNDEPVESGMVYEWEAESEGSYRVYLMSCNAYCCVRSAAQWIQVGACQVAQAGREWHFGSNVGLRFLENGMKEYVPSSIRTYEASSVAYDDQGNMLYYFDGTRIWNRNHVVMQNGLFLAGDPSSTQIITVPQPGNKNLWYLFYPEAYDSSIDKFDYKMFYGVVDMSMDGGLGAVISKDIVLFDHTTEKVAAVRHCNGADWWIIMHEIGNANFRVYSLTNSGLDLNPSIQEIGYEYELTPSVVASWIRSNKEGTMLGVGKWTSQFGLRNSTLELFRFDNSTGILSEPLMIHDQVRAMYGVEFSANSEWMYANNGDSIFQFDVRVYDEQLIRDSKRFLIKTNRTTGALARGPDGIIYISSQSMPLSAILDADSEDAYVVLDYYTLQPGEGRFTFGLPNFPNDIYETPQPVLSGPEDVCDTLGRALYRVAARCVTPTYRWVHMRNDGSVEEVNIGDSLWLKFSGAGMDTLIVEHETACAIWADTMVIEVLRCGASLCSEFLLIPEADTVVCLGEPAHLRLYTEGEHISMRRLPDGVEEIIESGWIDLGHPQEDICYEIRSYTPELCDTTVQVCVRVNMAQEFELLQLDSVVCIGEYAVLNITTTATEIWMYNRDGVGEYPDPVFPLVLGPIEGDSCYVLRLSTPEYDCDTLISFCISVAQDIDYEMKNLELEVCGDGEFELDFETTASVYILRELPGGMEVARDFSLPYRFSQVGDYELVFLSAGGGCEERFVFSTIQHELPVYNWLNSEDRICAGDTARWVIETDAIQMWLIEGIDTTLVSGSEILISGLLASDCRTLLLIGSGGCIQELEICIEVDESGGVERDSVWICYGDSMLIHGIWVSDPGTYIRLVEVSGSCDSVYVTELSMYSPLTISEELVLDCKPGQGTGRIRVSPSGGLAPYNIIWDGGNTQFELLGLESGVYSYRIVDAAGCDLEGAVVLRELELIWPQIEVIPPGCVGDLGGELILGGLQAGYLYLLDGVEIIDGIREGLGAGTYKLRVQTTEGCVADSVLVIPAGSILEVSMPGTITLLEGEDALIKPIVVSMGIVSYRWTPPLWLSCDDCETPYTSATSDIIYTLEVEDERGCISRGEVRVLVIAEEELIYIPTGFTPNGDGINDYLEIFFGSSKYKLGGMEIFNRWGVQVYNCIGDNCKWDGTMNGLELPPATYVCMLQIVGADGSVFYKTGEVVLVK